MTSNTPHSKVSIIDIPNSGGSKQLSIKTSSGYKVITDFTGDKSPTIKYVSLIPPQPYSEEFSPARTSIRPATGKTETNGVARENGSSLTVDEFKAINEAVQAFGGVAHKFGDALRDVLGKTSGVEFTFTDFAPLRMRDHPVTTTTPTTTRVTTTTTTLMPPVAWDR